MGIASQPSLFPPVRDEERQTSTELVMIGMSYKTAGVALRESLQKTLKSGGALESVESVKEVAVLSTCNRFELYFASSSPETTSRSFFDLVSKVPGLDGARGAFYQASGVEAVRHLFRVAAGLESMVMGEPQILAQVRGAGVTSRREGKAGGVLAPLFDRACRVGARVRRDFGFGLAEASLGDLAVEAVGQMSPGKRDVMLIGTGKMIRIAVTRLGHGRSRMFVATKRRALPKGLEDATIVPHSRLRETAERCDVIISATSTSRPILKPEDLRGTREKVIVDLGMPRNVSPEVRNLPNVRLLDLDDLAKLAGRVKPPTSAKRAESAIAREADHFYDWLVQTRLSTALAEIYSWADAVRGEELKRALGKLGLVSERDRRIVEAMGRRIVSKLLARPTRFARMKQPSMSEEEKLELLKSVFGAELLDQR